MTFLGRAVQITLGLFSPWLFHGCNRQKTHHAWPSPTSFLMAISNPWHSLGPVVSIVTVPKAYPAHLSCLVIGNNQLLLNFGEFPRGVSHALKNLSLVLQLCPHFFFPVTTLTAVPRLVALGAPRSANSHGAKDALHFPESSLVKAMLGLYQVEKTTSVGHFSPGCQDSTSVCIPLPHSISCEIMFFGFCLSLKNLVHHKYPG